ncbi:MAG: flagellar basal body-associated FliL family protein [Leptospirales bacterium]|nr:flagellar basal body-associated FliL family protein [Leptospirales bacterium]
MNLRRMVLIAAIAAAALIALLLFGPLAAYWTALQISRQQYAHLDDLSQPAPPPPLDRLPLGETLRIPLADGAHAIQTQVQLGYAPNAPAFKAELQRRIPQMRNIIVLIISSKRVEQVQGVEQRLELQTEIKASLNHILERGQIEDVWLQNFLML